MGAERHFPQIGCSESSFPKRNECQCNLLYFFIYLTFKSLILLSRKTWLYTSGISHACGIHLLWGRNQIYWMYQIPAYFKERRIITTKQRKESEMTDLANVRATSLASLLTQLVLIKSHYWYHFIIYHSQLGTSIIVNYCTLRRCKWGLKNQDSNRANNSYRPIISLCGKKKTLKEDNQEPEGLVQWFL